MTNKKANEERKIDEEKVLDFNQKRSKQKNPAMYQNTGFSTEELTNLWGYYKKQLRTPEAKKAFSELNKKATTPEQAMQLIDVPFMNSQQQLNKVIYDYVVLEKALQTAGLITEQQLQEAAKAVDKEANDWHAQLQKKLKEKEATKKKRHE